MRIDKFLAENVSFSRSKIKMLIESGEIKVNDESVKPNYKLTTDDEIQIDILPDKEVEILPVDIPIDIVYQDKDIIVVNKKSGMVVHPAVGHWDDTLVNSLLYHVNDLSGINGEIRPGIVHRIDKDTSGLLVVAKNDAAHISLSEQLKNHNIERLYIAICHGVIQHDKGRINAPIGRSKKDRKMMDVIDGGREAITHFEVLERFDKYSLIECKLETGRTHQIRVHMKYIGYPILGDPMYGRRKDHHIFGQFLHAKSISFRHPRTDEKMQFESDLPSEFTDFLEDIR